MKESVLLLLLRVDFEYVSRRRLFISNDRYRQRQGRRSCRSRRQRHHRCRQGHQRRRQGHHCQY